MATENGLIIDRCYLLILRPDFAAVADKSKQAGAIMFRLKVLVVDDHPSNRTVLRHILETLEAETVEAASGDEALQCIASSFFDLVLLDIHMPGLSGLDVARQVRRMPPGDQPRRVIAVTGDTTLTHREALAAGFDWVLFKPVRMSELVDELAVALRPRASERRAGYGASLAKLAAQVRRGV